MYQVWVLRENDWCIVGQYRTRQEADMIRADYQSRGETAEVRVDNF